MPPRRKDVCHQREGPGAECPSQCWPQSWRCRRGNGARPVDVPDRTPTPRKAPLRAASPWPCPQAGAVPSWDISSGCHSLSTCRQEASTVSGVTHQKVHAERKRRTRATLGIAGTAARAPARRSARPSRAWGPHGPRTLASARGAISESPATTATVPAARGWGDGRGLPTTPTMHQVL